MKRFLVSKDYVGTSCDIFHSQVRYPKWYFSRILFMFSLFTKYLKSVSHIPFGGLHRFISVWFYSANLSCKLDFSN